MGDSGFEPLTSSASKKYETLLEVSGACKIPANRCISTLAHFLTFQEIHSGCCTVAALGSPSGHAHRICTQLHNHAVLLPVVNKGTETDELERRDRALQRISV